MKTLHPTYSMHHKKVTRVSRTFYTCSGMLLPGVIPGMHCMHGRNNRGCDDIGYHYNCGISPDMCPLRGGGIAATGLMAVGDVWLHVDEPAHNHGARVVRALRA